MGITHRLYRASVPVSVRAQLGSVRAQLGAVRLHLAAAISKARLATARRRRRRPYNGQKVAVVGFFSTRSGLGRGSELIARSIEIRGGAVVRVDLPFFTELETIPHSAITADQCERMESGITDVIIVVNPPYFSRALSLFSTSWLRARVIVAHWVWELDVVSDDWNDAIKFCDEVWVSSEFAAKALDQLCVVAQAPLKVVPYPVDLDPFHPADLVQRKRARQKVGIHNEAFVAGYSFAASSNLPRKNPMGAVTAFQRAFPAEKDVFLIIRALDGHAYPKGMKELKRVAMVDPRVILVEHSSDLSIIDFYAAIDLYVSPARSEGYGLNIVEATQAGRPVVAVEWSLSKDVLSRPGVTPSRYKLIAMAEDQGNYANIKGASWAEPDIGDLSDKILAIYRLGKWRALD